MKLTSCNKTGPRGPAVWVAVFVPIGAPLPVVTTPGLYVNEKEQNKIVELITLNDKFFRVGEEVYNILGQ